MKNEKLQQTCNLFNQLTMIPLFCFDETQQLQFHQPQMNFQVANLLSMFTEYSETLPCGIYIDDDMLFWGLIRLPETKDQIIIGPVSSIPISDDIIHSVMVRHHISNRAFEELQNILSCSLNLSLLRFQSAVLVLYEQLTGQILSEEQIEINDLDLTSSREILQTVTTAAHKNYELNMHTYTMSYQAEQQLLRHIEEGNVPVLQSLFSGRHDKEYGILANVPLRNTKNLFIVIIAIAARCAIQNGLAVEVSYNISDQFIQQIELASDVSSLNKIVLEGVTEYSTRIQKLKIPKDASPLVHHAIQFIEKSVNQPITVEDVSRYIGKSKSYFATVFKKDTGKNIGDYITHAKIQEAKRLLKYTDKSILDISTYLCFSSQSYFQNVFKKLTGLTPLQYRNKN